MLVPLGPSLSTLVAGGKMKDVLLLLLGLGCEWRNSVLKIFPHHLLMKLIVNPARQKSLPKPLRPVIHDQRGDFQAVHARHIADISRRPDPHEERDFLVQRQLRQELFGGGRRTLTMHKGSRQKQGCANHWRKESTAGDAQHDSDEEEERTV